MTVRPTVTPPAAPTAPCHRCAESGAGAGAQRDYIATLCTRLTSNPVVVADIAKYRVAVGGAKMKCLLLS